ncbi:MAG: hypothetical protein ABEJ66_02635 [Candidatus Nanohaloarchaea archaeon]
MLPQLNLMDAPMLKRRLNPFLLVSTVLILSLLAGLSVFYQGQLNNLVTSKKELKQELQSKERRIQQLERKNANLSRRLRQKEDRITNLKSLLSSKRKQVQNLMKKVNNLQDRIEELQNSTRQTQDINETLGLICITESKLSDYSKSLCHREGHSTS